MRVDVIVGVAHALCPLEHTGLRVSGYVQVAIACGSERTDRDSTTSIVEQANALEGARYDDQPIGCQHHFLTGFHIGATDRSHPLLYSGIGEPHQEGLVLVHQVHRAHNSSRVLDLANGEHTAGAAVYSYFAHALHG